MSNGTPPAARAPTILVSEDWWAIWLGGLLIAVTAFGLVASVPAVGGWTGGPGAAFEGRVIGLAMLGFGLALITGVAARCMGGSIVLHQAGFFAVGLPFPQAVAPLLSDVAGVGPKALIVRDE